MRIATSTIYDQQIIAIDNQNALYAQIGQSLSSGKQLTNPSDDPAHIAQDLQLHTTIQTTNQQSTNVQSAINELTTTDSALSSLTSVLQSARTLAIQGNSETLTDSQRTAIANQIDELVQQSIAIGNTKYGSKYIFGGTASTANPPVVQQGNPIQAVTFSGNEQVQGQLIYNGQQFALSTTFQSAFNYQASDGSPDVFQTLINLRNSLINKPAVDQSASQINAAGQTVYGPQVGGVGPAPTTLAQTASFQTAPVPSGGNFTLQLHSNVNGQDVSQTVTVTPASAIDDGIASPPGTSLVQQINALTATTGITAKFNPATQSFSLTGTGTFYVTDVSGNLTKVLNLNSQADWVQNISTQIGTIDHTLNSVLNARSVIGARIQTLSSISGQLQSDTTDNTKVESGIEDTDVAAATSRFTQTQTALQAAYMTTTRLESKTLFDYLG